MIVGQCKYGSTQIPGKGKISSSPHPPVKISSMAASKLVKMTRMQPQLMYVVLQAMSSVQVVSPHHETYEATFLKFKHAVYIK